MSQQVRLRRDKGYNEDKTSAPGVRLKWPPTTSYAYPSPSKLQPLHWLTQVHSTSTLGVAPREIACAGYLKPQQNYRPGPNGLTDEPRPSRRVQLSVATKNRQEHEGMKVRPSIPALKLPDLWPA